MRSLLVVSGLFTGSNRAPTDDGFGGYVLRWPDGQTAVPSRHRPQARPPEVSPEFSLSEILRFAIDAAYRDRPLLGRNREFRLCRGGAPPSASE